MTYFRVCLIASLALCASACQSSSPQEDAPAPAVEKAEAEPSAPEVVAAPTRPLEDVADEDPNVFERDEDPGGGSDSLDSVFGPGSRELLRAAREDVKPRNAETSLYMDYETHKVRVLTDEQLAHPERVSEEEIDLALDKLGAAARAMRYDGKTPEQIAAHLRALGALVEIERARIRWSFDGENGRVMMTITEGLR